MIARLLLGPMTLSWRTVALLAPVGILAGLASTSDTDVATRLSWLGAAVISQLALTAAYALGSLLGIGRWRTGVLAVVVLGSGARAGALVALTAAFGDVDPLTPIERMIGGTVTFTLWGIGLGAAVQAWCDHREALRAMAVNADEALAQARDLERLWRQRLDTTLPSPEAVAATARALHDDVDSRLRPLSHRLWFTMTDRAARDQFLRSLLSSPFPLWWISALTVVALIWNTGFAFSLPLTILATAGGITCLVLILYMGQRIGRRQQRGSLPIVLASVLVASVTCGVVVAQVVGMTDKGVVAIIIIGLVGIILGIQVISTSARLRAESLLDLETRSQALASQRYEVAAYLHSTVQARWTAAARRLEEAGESGDLDAARHALHSARSLLENNGPPNDEQIDLTELATAWDGIAYVSITVDPLLPPHVHGVVGHIIDEAISNAVRHGRARNIQVTVTMGTNTADVIVDDDGTGPLDIDRRGLGSDWLDTVADWALTRTQSGSHLKASIAV